MKSTIRDRTAVTLLFGAMMVSLFTSPALAVASNNVGLSDGLRAAADRPAGDGVAIRTLAGVVVRKPDGRIRYGAYRYPGHESATQNPFVGNNRYNTSGASQTASALGGGGQDYGGFSFLFDVSIQNDGNRADRFRVKATGAATTARTASYYGGSTDITSAVAAGTFTTPSLAPGATYLIRAKITITLDGGSVVRLVSIRSVASPTKIDAVKFAYIYVASSGPGA